MTSPVQGKDAQASRLVLGTAQLGMPYGIANRSGLPDQEAATAIVKTAWENGIREFDTAQAYGISECILGSALANLGIAKEATITTKLDPALDPLAAQKIEQSVAESLQRLQVASLQGLMLHSEAWLDFWDDGLCKTLMKLVEQGAVQRVGVSLYTPHRAIQALESSLIDMIQLPANVLDRRFENAGVFELADKRGKQVYVRSVYLQGLLLLKPEELSPPMAFSLPLLSGFADLCQGYRLSRQQAAMLYIKERYPGARVIIGAETASQIEQGAACWNLAVPNGLMQAITDTLSDVDEILLDPSRWPTR